MTALLLFLDNTASAGEKHPSSSGKNHGGTRDFSRADPEELRQDLNSLPAQKYLYYPGSPNWNDEWEISSYLKRIQQGSDPGERIAAAFADAFDEGHGRVLWVSTDCPGLTADMIREAEACLDTYDVVLGPLAGGAFYLLGLKEPHPGLFANLPWQNGDAVGRTRYILQEMGLSYHLLSERGTDASAAE